VPYPGTGPMTHVEETTTLTTPVSGKHPEIGERVESGTRLGRYVVMGELGRGGMGVVVRAMDPKLGREVAIKVLHGRAWSSSMRDRLLREARAMAQLSHPNVVPVYDVDVHETLGPFVVMELVEGVTLREALQRGLPWRDLVELLVEAGRGLAAAHAHGLLHRDFKPRNVMVGPDGRARVTDFGLARGWHGDPDPHAHDSCPDPSGSDMTDQLTAAGMVVGTPPYMAPEQIDDRPLSPASDQYAFCVTAWELLLGVRPFPARGHESRIAKRRGPPPWPRTSAVPRRVGEVLRRGLDPEPERRWPDMPTLLAALQPPMRRRRVVWAGLALGAVGVSAVLALGDDADPRCSGARDRIEEIWNDAQEERVLASALASGREHAAGTSNRVAARLDAFVHAWAEQYQHACAIEADAAFDLRMACLRDARSELRATVELLVDADASAIDRTDRMLEELPDPSRCSDEERLADLPTPPAEDATAVWTARGHLARARALHHAGRYAEAAGALDIVESEARSIGYAPLTTEVLLLRGEVRSELGDYAEAEAAHVEALRSALAMGQIDEALRAATLLVGVVGIRQERAAEAEHHAERAWALLRENPDAAAEAELRAVTGGLRTVQGRYAEAIEEHRKALALREQIHGMQSLQAASGHLSLGNALRKAGESEEATAEYRIALEIRSHTLGVDHPEVTAARNALANSLLVAGRYAEAEADYREVLARWQQTLGEHHPHVAGARNNLALTLSAQGKLEEAEVAHRRAIAAAREALGVDHPFVAGAQTNLGAVLMKLGRHVEAEAEHRAALELRLRTRGTEHPLVAASHNNIALALAGQKRWREAVAEHRAAIAAMLEVLEADHPDVAVARMNMAIALRHEDLSAAEVELRTALPALIEAFGAEHVHVALARRELAEVLLARGEALDEAIDLAERSWATYTGAAVGIEERSLSSFTLAQALHDRDPTRATALAREALAGLREAGPSWGAEADGVRAWLARP
jgi:tetratricopeptide (TPR) repeat protein